MHVCVRACMRACVRACVRVCVDRQKGYLKSIFRLFQCSHCSCLQVMTSGPLELIEGAEGHKVVIHVTAPPDLICRKNCTIRVEVDIPEDNPLHCPKVCSSPV